jgi:hypothetical protein
MDKVKALGLIDALAPAPEMDADISPSTHEQAMACTACGLAGMTPDDHFPQRPGLWDRPCPKCGEQAVWVTPPREKNADQ